MIVFDIIAFFIIPANIALLFLVMSGAHEKIGRNFSLIFSYGVGPLLSGALFYYFIALFPNKSDLFYLLLFLFVYVFCVLVGRKSIKKLHLFYRIFAGDIIAFVKASKIFTFLNIFLGFFLLIYSLQALAYPLIGGDELVYVNQSRAVYENRNLDWQGIGRQAVINGNDVISYNGMIRPGIPSLLAAGYLIGGKAVDGKFLYQFFAYYYFALFFLIYLFIIKKAASLEKKELKTAMYFGVFFLIFSWGTARLMIFGAKECAIYFFVLLSIYLTYKLISENLRKNWETGILLGIILGLNSLVNLHGIIVEAVLIFLLLILSRNKLRQKIGQIFFIFLISIVFGGFEFVLMANNFFGQSIRDSVSAGLGFITGNSSGATGITNVSAYDELHESLYQFGSFSDMYLKGKLQIFTNIGYFGFYFWFFILIMRVYFKSMLKNKIIRVIISFVGVYFFIVIDPLFLNKHPLAIVLWGSQKYSMLLLLLSMIPLSLYLPGLLERVARFVLNFGRSIILSGLTIFFAVLLFKTGLINIGASMLFSTIQIYKEKEFYIHIVENIYYFGVFFLLAIIIAATLVNKTKKYRHAYNITMILTFLIFIFVPFSIVEPGKIALRDTFLDIGKSTEQKLKLALNGIGDKFKAYYFLRKSFPKNTAIATDFIEFYAFDDDYFSITQNHLQNNVKYRISSQCNDWSIIYTSGDINVCSR